jgi:hypothetical protein
VHKIGIATAKSSGFCALQHKDQDWKYVTAKVLFFWPLIVIE